MEATHLSQRRVTEVTLAPHKKKAAHTSQHEHWPLLVFTESEPTLVLQPAGLNHLHLAMPGSH